MITLSIPIRLVSEANTRDHWRAKHGRTKMQRGAVMMAWLVERSPKVQLPCTVRIIRVRPPTGRELDGDNMQSAAKATRDQLAVCVGLPVNKSGLADDRDPRCSWEYGQEVGESWAVRIEIVPRDA